MIQVGSRVRYVGLARVRAMGAEAAGPHLDRIGVSARRQSWGHTAGLVEGMEYIVNEIAEVAVGNGERCRLFRLYGQVGGFWVHEWQFEAEELEREWARVGDEVVYLPQDTDGLLAKYAFLAPGSVYRVSRVTNGMDGIPRYGFGAGFNGHNFKAHHFQKVTANLHMPANPARPRAAQYHAEAIETAFGDIPRPAGVGVGVLRTERERILQETAAHEGMAVRRWREMEAGVRRDAPHFTADWLMPPKSKSTKPKALPDNDYGVTYS